MTAIVGPEQGTGSILGDQSPTITSATLTGASVPDGSLLDLSAVVHDDAGAQGLHLPQAASATPTSPSSGEGFLAWDAAGNQMIAYNGSAWAAVGGGSGSGDALVANPLSQFAATTSAQLAGVISDETGSSLLVFNTSPTLVTPALGTPSAAVLTNATGLPVTGLANGTDGELITWSATGVAETVAVGTATHVLTSNGVGVAPTFQAAGGGSFDSTAQDALTWSDGANASNLWTFDVSGTDTTLKVQSDKWFIGAGTVHIGGAGSNTDLRISGGTATNTIYMATRDIHIATNAQEVHIGKISDLTTGLSVDCADGTVDLAPDLIAATGNEIAFDLQYTTNKATSGDDTGLLINLTDTASPGRSYLLRGQVGGTDQVGFDADGVLFMLETTTPTAITNYGRLYTKTDNKIYFQDGAGTEHEIAFV